MKGLIFSRKVQGKIFQQQQEGMIEGNEVGKQVSDSVSTHSTGYGLQKNLCLVHWREGTPCMQCYMASID